MHKAHLACKPGSHVFFGIEVGLRCLCGEEHISAHDIQELFCDRSILPLMAAEGIPLSWQN